MNPLFKISVEKLAKKRGISLLLHSTHLFKNLPQMLADRHVHTARELQERFGHERAARYLHDPKRYEQFAVGLDYVNCALTVPNAELLYHRSKSDWHTDWVHLALDVKLLNAETTLFSPVSAAAERGGFIASGREGFEAMFAEQVMEWNRAHLPCDEPTHPQAEVLIKGPLSIDDVRSILVPTRDMQQEVARLCERNHDVIPIEVTPHLFAWPARLMKS